VKDTHGFANTIENIFHPFRMRVGDKNLAKVIVAHQFHQAVHAEIVKLVENIIEQEQGEKLFYLFDEIKLRQLQRHKKRLLLPLGGKTFYRVIVHRKNQIVLMNANRSVFQDSVARNRLTKMFFEVREVMM